MREHPFLHTRQGFLLFSPSADKSYLTYPYPTRWVDKIRITTCVCQYIGCLGGHITLSLDFGSWRHCNVTYDINFQYSGCQRTGTWLIYGDSLQLNAGDQKVCKKKNLSWSFGADRKFHPSGSLFGITRHSLVMPNSDPWTDFSVCWKILIILLMV